MNRTESSASNSQDKFNTSQADKLKATVFKPAQPAVVSPAPVSVMVSGASNKVDVSVQKPKETPVAQHQETVDYESEAGQGASSAQSDSYFSKTKLPLSVALVIGGLGLGLICLVIFWALKTIKRSSAAGAAILDATDTGLAKLIHAAESKLQSATDPKDQAAHAMQLADLNKLRGQIAEVSPPPK